SEGKKVAVQPAKVVPVVLDDDTEAIGFAANTFASPRTEWQAIDEELSKAFDIDPSAPINKPNKHNHDEDDTVDGFVNDNPDYVKKMLEKKLELYASHIKEMKSRMEKWQEHKKAYVERIKLLEDRIREQTDDFLKAQEEWEQEALTLSKQSRPNRVNLNVNDGNRQELERQKAKEAMRQMLHGATEFNNDDLDDDLSNFHELTIRLRLAAIFKRLIPLSRDIKQIEARFGKSVATYFVFYRWVILNYMILSIPSLYMLVLHIFELSDNNYSSWTQFTDFVPSFLLFPSYTANEAVHYSAFIVITSGLLLLVSTEKWLKEDRVAKLVHATDAGKQYTFSKLVLNAWDFEVRSREDALDLQKSIGESICIALYDDIKKENIRNRTKRERYKLYARRTLSSITYLIVQSVSWTIIGLLTIEASSFAQVIKDNVPALQTYAPSVVPLGVNVINGALPPIINLLTNFEKWDDNGFSIKAMVTRLFLAQILNTLLQLWAYAMLLDPFLYVESEKPVSWLPNPYIIRSNVMQKFKPDLYTCRAEQVASRMFLLVLTNFLTPKVSLLAMNTVFKLLQLLKKFRAKRKHLEFTATDLRTEFLIAPKMVGLMCSCTLYAFAIPLCPIAPIVTVFLLITSFKFEKHYLFIFQKKPAIPWSAKDAGAFFIKFYWCTIAVYFGGVYWFLSDQTLPKICAMQVRDIPFLCSSYDTATQTCQLNTTHSMSYFFIENFASECSSYPKCICSKACGPFVNTTSGSTPLIQALLAIDGVSTILNLATSAVLLIWIIVLLLFMQIMFASNTVGAANLISILKDQEAKSQIAALIKKIENVFVCNEQFRTTQSHVLLYPKAYHKTMRGGAAANFKKVTFSGIQPTGVPHLGNYCGAVSKWVEMQTANPAPRSSKFHSIVDLHAITMPYDHKQLQTNIRDLTASLLGCGLDPEKIVLFKQSDVREHSELAWLLNCVTPLSWLNRMTQFKQKSQQKDQNNVLLGLLSYPVLMTADVLLYKATHAAVGEDQQQHLELARMIATTFNDRFKVPVFPKTLPVRSNPDEQLLRIMSLKDPTKKMSKSDKSPSSRIDLTDSPDTITKKIRKAQTDSLSGISFDKAERPGVTNLISILSVVSGMSVIDIEHQYGSYQSGEFKNVVAEAVVEKIGPIGARITEYQQDPAYLDKVLKEGQDTASGIAAETMIQVKQAMGLA
ncbi:tryptophanyl-tRNA synthetase, partial [Thraustotheca clavata]